MTEDQQMIAFIRHYRQQTGKNVWDMHDVAKEAKRMGWKMPKPQTSEEILAKKFSRAARTETRVDPETGERYRVNHAVVEDGSQMTLWVDIDDAPRHVMHKSVTNRREQVVGDLLQLTTDVEHWNRKNPSQEPLQIPLDFGPDIEWRKFGGDAGTAAA